MERYGSLSAVLNAPVEDLQKVEGIGRERRHPADAGAPGSSRKARLADAAQETVINSTERAGTYLLERFAGETAGGGLSSCAWTGRESCWPASVWRRGRGQRGPEHPQGGGDGAADLRQRGDPGPQPPQRRGPALARGQQLPRCRCGRPCGPSAWSWWTTSSWRTGTLCPWRTAGCWRKEGTASPLCPQGARRIRKAAKPLTAAQ